MYATIVVEVIVLCAVGVCERYLVDDKFVCD